MKRQYRWYEDSSSCSSSEQVPSKKMKPFEKKKQPLIPPTVMCFDDIVDGIDAIPVDFKEYSDAFVYEIEMSGMKSDGEIKVMIEDNGKLMVSCERNKDEGVRYLKTERKIGKFIRKFSLPKNAHFDSISALYQDGVLNVIVDKLPPPKPRIVKVVFA